MRLAKAFLLPLFLSLALFAGEVPRPAKPLKATTLEGKTISLEQLKGKVVMVMFFNTDCPHCQKTTELLHPIYKEWKSRGLEILGLALNPSAAQNLGEFAQTYHAEFPLALTTRGECTRFAEIPLMERFYVPYIMFVDRNGMVRAEHPGQDRRFYADQENNIRAQLDALLKEPAKKSKPSS